MLKIKTPSFYQCLRQMSNVSCVVSNNIHHFMRYLKNHGGRSRKWHKTKTRADNPDSKFMFVLDSDPNNNSVRNISAQMVCNLLRMFFLHQGGNASHFA